MLPGAKLKYDQKYLKNALVTNYDVNSQILGKHDLPEAIYKMLAVENGKKPSLGISKLGF